MQQYGSSISSQADHRDSACIGLFRLKREALLVWYLQSPFPHSSGLVACEQGGGVLDTVVATGHQHLTPAHPSPVHQFRYVNSSSYEGFQLAKFLCSAEPAQHANVNMAKRGNRSKNRAHQSRLFVDHDEPVNMQSTKLPKCYKECSQRYVNRRA